MLGNDIVDLSKANAESNWKRKGYLAKLFNEEEQNLINLAKNPATMLWLLWSMKEASYKIANRANGQRFYSPKSFNCSILQNNSLAISGQVLHQNNCYFTESEVTVNFVHSTAVTQKRNFETVNLFYGNYHPNYLQQFNGITAHFLLVKNKNGLPQIINKKTGNTQVASISHHGNYLAIVY